MHIENCVGLEADKEEDTESEVRLENDQQPIKLQNSQIFNNLGSKLSHLPSFKRKELAEVINDKEVQYMLKNDIIEESQSDWSSPCFLVPNGGF